MKTINIRTRLIRAIGLTLIFMLCLQLANGQMFRHDRYSELRGFLARETTKHNPQFFMIAERSPFLFIDDCCESDINLEEWMINEESWINNSKFYEGGIFDVEEIEMEYEIEDWMMEQWNVQKIIRNDNQIEDWMYIALPPNIVSTLCDLVSDEEAEQEIEKWMLSSKDWNN